MENYGEFGTYRQKDMELEFNPDEVKVTYSNDIEKETKIDESKVEKSIDNKEQDEINLDNYLNRNFEIDNSENSSDLNYPEMGTIVTKSDGFLDKDKLNNSLENTQELSEEDLSEVNNFLNRINKEESN